MLWVYAEVMAGSHPICVHMSACRERVPPLHALSPLYAAGAAGFTNLLWMRPGRVAIQLMPYGWEGSPGKVTGYAQLARNMNCTHLLWRNMRPEHAHFNEATFEGSLEEVHRHPTPEEVAAGRVYNEKGAMHDHFLFQVRMRLAIETRG